MSRFVPDALYQLLPAIYRIRDEEQGGSLKALLAIIAAQTQIVEQDIEHLYDNWFIETCDEWLIPYIGDLLGVQGSGLAIGNAFLLRPQVANTLSYRRRKGTATMLEQLARDTTGWYAHAVEFFEHVGTTQYWNHIRPGLGGTVSLRLQGNELELLDTPFDTIARTAEVRRIDTQHGRYNIPNIGLFVWRLQTYRMDQALAFSHGTGQFSFSPLGNDMPLFNNPQPEPDISHLAEEQNMPGPLRRRPLAEELETCRQLLAEGKPCPNLTYFGDDPVLQVYLPPEFDPIPPAEMLICDLSNWQLPPKMLLSVAVDPILGRIAFPANVKPSEIKVSYSSGFPGDMGGGPYERRSPVVQAGKLDTVAHPDGLGMLIRIPADSIDLSAALSKWESSDQARCVIQFEESRIYNTGGTTIAFDANHRTELIIQAANHQRPVLVGDLTVTGGSGSESLTLNGLLISGILVDKLDQANVQISASARLKELNIIHCTIVPGGSLDSKGWPQNPGQPSVIVEDVGFSQPALQTLQIDHSIVGPLRLPSEMESLNVRDSILDSPTMDPYPALASGNLLSITIVSPSPRIMITIGREGPFIARLPGVPATLESARAGLQTAINSAHNSLAFRKACVIAFHDRLVIIPGLPVPLTVTPVKGDSTAAKLRLVGSSVQQVQVLVSPPVRNPCSSGPLPYNLPGIGRLSAGNSGSSEAAARISAGSRSITRKSQAVSTSNEAVSIVVDNRVMIIPGFAAKSTKAKGSKSSPAAPLQVYWPGIAADESGKFGPPTTLERSTVFGSVYVKELQASETVFTHPVQVERRQAGCVRFSYLPDQASSAPTRYRCQPDLALEGVIDEVEKDRLRATLEPSFTSTRYGTPAYAQLSLACDVRIRCGGEDESEMGAFHFLQQSQRETNLRNAMDEYLRVGLIAGIFYTT